MASLGVFGDPDGWLHAGGSMSSVIQQLEDELGEADSGGGSGLGPHWYGPASDAYQGAWQQRRQRYDDLIGQGKPAASAISRFGDRMLDFQRTALDLERKWLGAGLALTADGLRFTLAAHHASLPQELKVVFESLLGESERDIAQMWRDIDGAVQDLVHEAAPAIAWLEEFAPEAGGLVIGGLAGLTILGGGLLGALRGMTDDYYSLRELPARVHEAAQLIKKPVESVLGEFADDAERYAGEARAGVEHAAPEILGPEDRAALDESATAAERNARVLRSAIRVTEVEGDVPGDVVADAATVGLTAYDVHKDGWYNAMVQHKDAGLVIGAVTTDAIMLAVPELDAVPGGAAVAGVAGVGVGYLVQGVVDAEASWINGHPQFDVAAASAMNKVGHDVKAVVSHLF